MKYLLKTDFFFNLIEFFWYFYFEFGSGVSIEVFYSEAFLVSIAVHWHGTDSQNLSNYSFLLKILSIFQYLVQKILALMRKIVHRLRMSAYNFYYFYWIQVRLCFLDLAFLDFSINSFENSIQDDADLLLWKSSPWIFKEERNGFLWISSETVEYPCKEFRGYIRILANKLTPEKNLWKQ